MSKKIKIIILSLLAWLMVISGLFLLQAHIFGFKSAIQQLPQLIGVMVFLPCFGLVIVKILQIATEDM
jgi:hypothetical protein